MSGKEWRDDELSMFHLMWGKGKNDVEITKALNDAGFPRTVKSVAATRKRHSLSARNRVITADMSPLECKPALSPREENIRANERFVDAMIAAGYLPYDPSPVEDGAAASFLRHQAQPRLQGSSWGF